jgi:hypothetical protein
MIGTALGRSQKAHQDAKEHDLSKWQAVAKATANARDAGSSWIYRLFAITCVFIVISPLVLPLMADVAIHFYVPESPGFLAWFGFDTAKMIEYQIPAEPLPTAKHVALFPYMYSFASNVAWFYMAGKPLKHRF